MSINSFLEKLKQRVSPTPVDETGMWYQDKDVVVPSNKITMKGPEGEDDYFDEPIVGTGMQSGKSVVMQPGEDYEFPDDDSVYESKQMQLGGNIDNISPEGDVDFSLGNKNKLAFTVRGSGNIPNFKLNSVSPNLSYNNKGFSADVSPNSFGAGYNNSKVNLNANATMRNNAVESAGIQGSYNVTPNLSLTGNYNINKGEQGTDKNYFAGFRYSKSFKEGGELPPRYTSNPRDSRLRSYNDSLSLYNQYLKPAEINKTLKEIKNDSRFRYYRPSTRTELNSFPGKIKPILGTEFDFSRIDADLISGRSTKHNYYPTFDSSGRIIPGEVGTHLSFKKPVQPYIYKKPEVVPEVVETPLPVAPIDQPVKKIGYNKPIIQQFNYMSNENKAKALQKYGSVGDIPFQGVDINQLKKGGEIDHDDDKDMVNGVASILRRVKDPKNRLQLANQLSKQFNREKVKYDLPSFLTKSKVNK